MNWSMGQRSRKKVKSEEMTRELGKVTFGLFWRGKENDEKQGDVEMIVEGKEDGDLEDGEEEHLFNDDERERVTVFLTLSGPAQELFIKLMMRKYKIERIKKLNYPCIDMDTAVTELLDVGFAKSGMEGVDGVEAWMGLLSREEVVGVARERRVAVTGTVEQIREAVMKSLEGMRTLFGGEGVLGVLRRRVKEVVGPTIQLTQSTITVFQRLFIVYNREQHWPDNFFVLHIRTNLKKDPARFHPYRVDRVTITWPVRADLDRYLEALEVERGLRELMEGMPRGEVGRRKGEMGDVEEDEEEGVSEDLVMWGEMMLEVCRKSFGVWERDVGEGVGHVSGIPWLSTFTHGWVRTRIMEIHYYVCARLRKTTERITVLKALLSQRLYYQRHRGIWYDNLALALHTHKRQREALEVCEEALRDPGGAEWGEEKLRTSVGENVPEQTIVAAKITQASSQKAIYIDDDGIERTVEDLALHHYSKTGWVGHHSENSIITTLFGLLFWDIIFDDTVPGVFVSPFQDAPLDLLTEFFMLRDRSELGMFEMEEVVEIAELFGGEALARCIKLVEVKGEGDRLSSSQKVWLEFLLAANVDVEVFHVALPREEGKEKKKRRRKS
ncbi:hypothetical protein BC829DRAFT_490871 [Chytridium lagenaria]|nr:hypothetical protein BC829DRAFT_490871 [Chytridium lagenaria]